MREALREAQTILSLAQKHQVLSLVQTALTFPRKDGTPIDGPSARRFLSCSVSYSHRLKNCAGRAYCGPPL